jgi:hypothetical protein
MASSPIKLNIAKIIVGAAIISWYKRFELSRALIVPFFGFIVMEAYWFYGQGKLGVESDFLTFLLYWSIVTVFAVRCHRIILTNARTGFKLSWTMRETRFLIWALSAALIKNAVILAVKVISGAMFYLKPSIIEFCITLFLIYPFARLNLIFPAAALDRRPTIKWAWRLSASNDWQLVFIGILFWCTSFLLELSRADTNIVNVILTSLVIYATLPVILVTAWSLSYKELVNSQIIIVKPQRSA